ncbi:MAG: VCBS repeat-containing protein [Acidobacteria bacterium]|nr:VCBS repeat-containing protein [Acidobacteriota bacterium]
MRPCLWRVLGILLIIALAAGWRFERVAPAQTALDSEELAFVQLINNYRQQNGLAPLQVSVTLTNAAKWMSADMAARGYFSHTDSLGRDPFVRMAAFGYNYQTYKGENIAAGNSTALATFNQWKNSAGHNQNMLTSAYTVMGIGRVAAPGSPYGYYWTNDFGGYVDQIIPIGPPPSPTPTATPTPLPIPVFSLNRAFDFDGDRRADLGTWRPVTGVWNLLYSSTGGQQTRTLGTQEDILVPGDYDGDGKVDLAVWRPSTGLWSVVNSATGMLRTQAWGSGAAAYADIPVPGDYDGDGKTDIAVWRATTATWYILTSSNGQYRVQAHGAPGDQPVLGDFDGDRKADLAVWRPSTGAWLILNSSTGVLRNQAWGLGTAPYNDVPVPGDYDGDGKTDLAVWRTSTGVWYILNSATGQYRIQQWGLQAAPYNDVPAPGDFDGDGKTDIAIWRAATATWYILNSSTGQARVQQWGATGEKPL